MISKNELSNFRTFVKFIEQAIYGKKRRIRRNKPTIKTSVEKPNKQVALVKEIERKIDLQIANTKSNEIEKDSENKAEGKIFNSDNFLPKTIT